MTQTFGDLLKQLRKRNGLTQRDLASVLGYSNSLISSLEKAQRLPDLDAVIHRFIPALGLEDDPAMAVLLIECAAAARGERPPADALLPWAQQIEHGQERSGQTYHLPALPTELIGRSAEVSQICDRLLNYTCRLLTLIGPPGVGKTTLALTVAARLQPHYRDGVVFVPLAAIRDPMLMAATIVAAVAPDDVGATSPETRLIAILRRKTILLVLDNLEQIEGVAPLIATLLAECPSLQLLATSRERLHLRAEQRFKVSPLDLTSAVDLFVRQAQAVDENFRLTSHNQATVTAICERLDCLPLALELCGSQLELFSPAQLLSQLQARLLDLLVDGPNDLPPQHRTLRQAIQRSCDMLREEERTLFRRLSVCAGGFDLAAIEAIGTGTLDHSTWNTPDQMTGHAIQKTLRTLIGKSLVRAETLPHGEQRFLMLETIREFALEQLAAVGERDLIHQQHYHIYLNLARTADRKVRGPEVVGWFARLDREHDNLRAAWQWALDSQHFVDAAWLGVALCHTWFMRAHWYEGAQWLEKLLPHRHQLAPDLRLALLLTLYRFWRALHNFQAIDQYGQELTDLSETCPAGLLRAATWFYIAVSRSDADQSIMAFDTCLALLHETTVTSALGEEFCFFADSVHLQAMVLVRYAIRLTDDVGAYEQAEKLTNESLHLFRQLENRDFIVYALGNLGRLALVRGDIAQAHQFFHEAVTIATTASNPLGLGDWQPRLGIVTFYAGNIAEAYRLLDECLNLWLRLGNNEFLARIYGYLAEVAMADGELAQAEVWLTQSLAFQTKLRWLTFEFVDTLFVSARLATAQQAYPLAAMRFGLAEQVRRHIGYVRATPMRPQIEAALAMVRNELDADFFTQVYAAGQKMSLTQAFATVLTPDHSGILTRS